MQRILVIADPVNSEQKAFARAIELVGSGANQIHVVSFCYDAHCDGKSTLTHNPQSLDLKGLLMDHVKSQWAQSVEGKIFVADVTHEVVWAKHIHSWVHSHCEQVRYDMIVKTGHRSESAFHTPTDWMLLRGSSVPVYLVAGHAASEKQFAKGNCVLAALDLSTHQKDEKQLNDKVLDNALRLAEVASVGFQACFALRLPEVLVDLDIVDGRTAAKKLEAEAREGIARWAEPPYYLSDDRFHTKVGQPWKVVNELADELAAKVVVVGSISQSKGLKEKLLGSAAERIIHESATDILVV